jgi:site-specific DNA-methyltransferase (adenine-specific)
MSIELIHGDCLEVMPELDQKVDLVLVDPPYGITSCKWDLCLPFEIIWPELWRLSKGRPVCMFGSEPFSTSLRMSQIKNFKYDWIWYKNTCSGISLAKFQPMRCHESISVFYKGKTIYNKQETASRIDNIETREGKVRKRANAKIDFNNYKETRNNTFSSKVNPRSVLEFNSVNNANGRWHPTQKPIALLEYLIKTYTNKGDTVLDFCMGSGSTGVACQNTGRNFIGRFYAAGLLPIWAPLMLAMIAWDIADAMRKIIYDGAK